MTYDEAREKLTLVLKIVRRQTRNSDIELAIESLNALLAEMPEEKLIKKDSASLPAYEPVVNLKKDPGEEAEINSDFLKDFSNADSEEFPREEAEEED